VAAEIVDGEDVRVIQRRDRARFLLEAAQAVRVGRDRRRKGFDGDIPIEARVVGALDLAHAAGPYRAEDFIRTAPRAGRQAHAVAIIQVPGGYLAGRFGPVRVLTPAMTVVPRVAT